MAKLQPESKKKALAPVWFPANFQAVIWRNWGIVPKKNIAAALECTQSQLEQSAKELGLDPNTKADPIWLKRGYLTIIRNNWHIATYAQILALLEIDEDELAFILKEDDFMWAKMGAFKPSVDDNLYRALTETEKTETQKISGYGKIGARPDNSFGFLGEFYGKSENGSGNAAVCPEGLRIAYSYFAIYGDPLLNEELDPYPDELLSRYAKAGVNGVWLQGILYHLAEFAFDPELSKDKKKRIANLNKLITRAAKYGIGVYLYMNEPRAMPEEFFEKYPHLKGEPEYDTFAMCTSQPEVQNYLYGAMKEVFTEAKGLAGFIAITMSENLTNCYSRTSREKMSCESCKKRRPAEVVAEVNNILAKGAHDADPSAKAISWTWAWGDDWAKEAIGLLAENQILQCTSEEGLSTNVGGIPGSVLDYTISKPGPGEKSKSNWECAARLGLGTSAKVQINCTWELSTLPYIPALDLIEKHVKNLHGQNIKNFQLCWTLGGYPSINMQFADYLNKNPKKGVSEFLDGIFGADLGQKVYEAQKTFSGAFAEFPFHIATAYVAPQNFGVSAPFYMQKTGYGATMIGFPYDDIDSWRSIYPAEIYETQMQKVANGMEEALKKFDEIENPENKLLCDMATIAEAALCHMKSACNHIGFVRSRNANDRPKMAEAVKKEKENVLRLIELRQMDSRIGFEASNHYFYTMQNLREKLINLDWAENGLS
ncbi:MAG: hypothetical protein FWG34_13620 [Oscillospiraceae bacterium]|nr:hypothetical protein [Oscillospiraceae bacterium]